MAETGRLLAIVRGDLLHGAAGRMIEEGYSAASVIVIKDAHDQAPDITGMISELLASAPAT
jgi:hypothetical protein